MKKGGRRWRRLHKKVEKPEYPKTIRYPNGGMVYISDNGLEAWLKEQKRLGRLEGAHSFKVRLGDGTTFSSDEENT